MQSEQQRRRKGLLLFASILLVAILGLTACSLDDARTVFDDLLGEMGSAGASDSSNTSDNRDAFDSAGIGSPLGSSLDASSIPAYSGEASIEVNGNVPSFSEADAAVAFGTELYGDLDSLGRCTGAFALVGRETQPTSKRGNISNIKPSGWKQNLDLYALGLNHLYERSHLIAHKLTGEDANERNLITGTHYLNQGAMSYFETIVGDYVDATGGHVLMRVTPIFNDDELVARGVQMEAYSVEDGGSSVSFNVFCYNVQPGVTIDYATGNSFAS